VSGEPPSRRERSRRSARGSRSNPLKNLNFSQSLILAAASGSREAARIANPPF